MTDAAAKIRFKARLLRPAATANGGCWSFLILPKAASSKLPTRSQTTVRGTINGHSFRATLEPDGRRSHWLKVTKRMRDAASADIGDLVTLELMSTGKEPQPRVPADLQKALSAAPKAQAVWSEITPIARRDWIQWITSAKRPETRVRRVKNACEMLASGKRRVCCFDRSGFYGKALRAPKAAD